MAKGTPAEIAEKWSRRTAAATEDMRAGIERVSVAPGAMAARKRDKWEAGVRNAGDKWQRNVGRVSLDEWKRKALEVGVSRVASGVAANVDKTQAFLEEFIPHLERGQAKVDAMPDVSLEDGINRAAVMMRHNAEFKRGGGR